MSEQEVFEQTVFRHPSIPDGLRLWRAVDEVGTLDLNSTYAYLMVCRDFADTCIVAERAGHIDGFVMGYRPPQKSETVFVWQVGVVATARGRGLGSAVLDRLLESDACQTVRFVETNVTPSNGASRALFEALAKRLDASIEEEAGFGSELFADSSHEPERLLRIGPFEPRRRT